MARGRLAADAATGAAVGTPADAAASAPVDATVGDARRAGNGDAKHTTNGIAVGDARRARNGVTVGDATGAAVGVARRAANGIAVGDATGAVTRAATGVAKRAGNGAATGVPVGAPTRGTTNPNRLRRVDRWLTGTPAIGAALRAAADPLVVDLGYGASPVTTVELARRLRVVRRDVRVLGLELDPARVAAAAPSADPPRLDFRRGGFELAGTRPVLIRAFNVLRQYGESEVEAAWARMLAGLAPGGRLVEGTCDEIGRRCAWITLSAGGPETLTLSCRTAHLGRPSAVAERLPKSLIHRNVPGEPVHEFLSALDACWDTAAGHQTFGARARWTETIRLLTTRGWPVLDRHPRWRLGEVTVPYSSVAPL